MTILQAGAPLAVSWFPESPGGIVLVLFLMLIVSWWLMGRVLKERDWVTQVFRALMSVLLCIGVYFFNQSLVELINSGPLAKTFETKAAKDARLRRNMQQWMAAPAFDAYWSPAEADPSKLKKMSLEARKEFQANRVPPAVLIESAIRGLTWMSLEHELGFASGHDPSSHAERGTKPLNNLTVAQAQAMFEFIQIVSPRSVRDAQPYLEGALAYCREASAPAAPGAASSEPAVKPAAGPYPIVEARRETPRGRSFLIRVSATETRVIEAGSEEEALKIAKQR